MDGILEEVIEIFDRSLSILSGASHGGKSLHSGPTPRGRELWVEANTLENVLLATANVIRLFVRIF